MSKLKVIRYKSSTTKRAMRTRGKIKRVSELPRLLVHKSNKYMYAQIADDKKGNVLGGAHGVDPKVVGETIAKKALEMKITKVVFDRGIYKYHGQVKLLAEAAREAGLTF